MTTRFVSALSIVALVAGLAFADKDPNRQTHLGPHTPGTPSALEAGPFFDLDITGVTFVELEGSPLNTVILFDAAAALGQPSGSPQVFNGVGWDYTFSTIGASWGNEAVISFGPDGGPAEIFLTASGTAGPVTSQNVSSGGPAGDPDIVKFGDIPIPDVNLPNGVLRMEFFDTFQDNPGLPDAIVESGILRLQFVPEPGSFSLFALAGLACLGLRRRG